MQKNNDASKIDDAKRKKQIGTIPSTIIFSFKRENVYAINDFESVLIPNNPPEKQS